MTSNDRFKEAVDLTTGLDLPQDTALPAQRKRHVSLILKDVADPFEGGMERAALGTVFGVHEYTESKFFWDLQEASMDAAGTGTGPNGSNNNDRHTGDSSPLIQPYSTSAIFQVQTPMTGRSTLNHPLASNISLQQHSWQSPNGPQLQHQVSPHSLQLSPSYSDPIKKGGQLQNTIQVNNNIPSSGSGPVGATFTLPDIPAVSKFDDWLTTSSQVLSSKARVISPSTVKYSPPFVNTTHGSHQPLDTEVAPPLIFLSYPPAIFDLLKSDTDDRIILWGPDPQFISMSGATMANYSLTSLQPVPSNLGFSSNTTTAAKTPSNLSIHSQSSSVRGSNSVKLTMKWTSKMKQSIHQLDSSSSSTIGSNKKNDLVVVGEKHQQKPTLPSRFSRRLSSKKDQHQEAYSSATYVSPTPPPMVIQAATVEKLVEKLTLALDYTFMTDFFLTYRTFISPTQLCKLLILRFQWGLEHDEDDRRVVRIRTFVVIRHWLLNYFAHDFVSSRELRKTLTLFLNTLPSHSLVKHSPLDQRIVKGLKRVIRRLKAVHYPKSSQRVQVISPPPPNFDEEQVRGMLHGKLSQGLLRRKTDELFHKDMAIVDSWRHHGNMAFQDARTADIVVVGSSDKSPLPPAPTPSTSSPSLVSSSTNRHGIGAPSMASTRPCQQSSPTYFDYNGKRQRKPSQNSIIKYAALTFSRKRLQQQELHRVKESYLHRMEQQKRTIQAQQQFSPDELEHDLRQLNLQHNDGSGATSDVSLDSIISPGTTDDELQEHGSDDDNDSAMANDNLEVMDDRVAHQNDSDQVAWDMAQRNRPLQTTPDNPAMANRLHRRSVYNAVLSDLSPLVSPTGSVIHGPLVHTCAFPRSNGHPVVKFPQGRQLATPSSSMDKMLQLPMELNMNGLDGDKTASDIADEHPYTDEKTPPSAPLASSDHQHNIPQVKNRVSKALLENGERGKSVLMDELDTQDEKALVESPTSMSLKSTGSESVTTTRTLQHKLSHRLINAFRSAGNIRPTTATVVQPEMMMSSTVASSIHKNSIVAQSNHRPQQHYYNKPDSPPHSHDYQRQYVYGYNNNNSNIGTEWTPSQSTVAESHKPHQYHQPYQPQHPDINYLKNIRASLDEDIYYYSRNTMEAEERNQQHQYYQQQQRQPLVPELDTSIPRRSTDNIPPSLSALFKPSMILQHRSHALAQQFCLVEKWMLLQINWEELVHCRWTKMGDSLSTSSADNTRKMDGSNDSTKHYSRQQQRGGEQEEKGIQQLINRFNLVCRWVSSEIVRTPSLDERVLVIQKFIRLAQKCHMYSNFATLIQILLGLQSPSVSRLRKTWSKVADSEMRLLEQLSSFTSPMKNWKHIRDSMTMVADEYGMSPREIQIQLPGSSDRHQLNQTKIKLPFGGCIPFLGLYLSDLVFNSEQPSYLEPNHDHHKIYQSYLTSTSSSSGNNLSPALLRQPLVNFRKHRITATIIKRFLTFRDLASRYSFEQVDALYSDCFYLDALETDTLTQLSLTIEPPPPSPPTMS